MRPPRKQAYFDTAAVWAQQSTCNRKHVGCVLVSPDGFVIATGYNGSERGRPHCVDVGCYVVEGHCARTIHAEKNALLQAAFRGESTRGTGCYSTMKPCFRCQMELRQAGVAEFFWVEDYDDYPDNPGDMFDLDGTIRESSETG